MRSSSIRSAALPGSSEPVTASSIALCAPSIVAIRKICSAPSHCVGSAPGAECTSPATRIKSHTLAVSLEETPSVPSATVTPALSNRRTGATPEPSLRLETTLCATETPARPISAMSASRPRQSGRWPCCVPVRRARPCTQSGSCRKVRGPSRPAPASPEHGYATVRRGRRRAP